MNRWFPSFSLMGATFLIGFGAQFLFTGKPQLAELKKASPQSPVLAELPTSTAIGPLSHTHESALFHAISQASLGELKQIAFAPETTRSHRLLAAKRLAREAPLWLLDKLKGLGPEETDVLAGGWEMRALLFRTWVLYDPEMALAEAKKARLCPGFENAIGESFTSLIESDPQRGFAFAEQDHTLLDNIGVDLRASAWESDPEAFVKASMQMSRGGVPAIDPFFYARLTATLEWSRQSPDKALEWAQSLPSLRQEAMLPIVVGEIAKTYVKRALSVFEGLAPSAIKERLGPAIVATWAATDPKSAILWSEQQLQGGKQDAYEAWSSAILNRGVAEASALIASLPDSSNRDRATGKLIEQWASQDFPQAQQWISGLPDGPMKWQATQALVSRWSTQDWNGLTQEISSHISHLSPGTVANIGCKLLSTEPAKTLEWMATLPAGRAIDHFKQGIDQLAQSPQFSSQQVASIVSGLSRPEMQQQAAQQVIKRLKESNPDALSSFLSGLPASLQAANSR